MEMLSRAHLRGLARGLSADRPPRAVQLLRGFHPHHRLDVQPARQMARRSAQHIPWRRPIASLNYLLSSHVWRQDHNGFSHQDPGFIDHVINKAPRWSACTCRRCQLPALRRRSLPAQPQLRQRHRGRQTARSALARAWTRRCCTAREVSACGNGRSRRDDEPDVVLACAGDVPTLETLAAVDLLRSRLPELNVRVVNVVDLMRLRPTPNTPTACPTASSTPSSPPTNRSSSPTTATPR